MTYVRKMVSFPRMFPRLAHRTVRLLLSVSFTVAAMLPPGAFLCVDASGRAQFEVAAIDQLSPIDQPGHRDEGLPDGPGCGEHSRPCHDYRLGAFHDHFRSAGVTCPLHDETFALLLQIDDAFACASDLPSPSFRPDVGDPPDSRPQRIALRI